MNSEDSGIKKANSRERKVTYFTLFTTTGTLICCVLPILLISLGALSTLTAMYTNVPFLITISQHKIWVFIFSAIMLSISTWLMVRPGRSCPVDPELAKKCASSHKWSIRILWVSIIIWSIGFFAAYLLEPLARWLDS